MELYVQRMITEKEDLEGKIKKSNKILENNPFNMTVEEKKYLKEQVNIMNSYLNVLKKRIDLAKGK